MLEMLVGVLKLNLLNRLSINKYNKSICQNSCCLTGII